MPEKCLQKWRDHRQKCRGPVPSKCSNSDLKNLFRSNFRSEMGCEMLKYRLDTLGMG